VPATTQTVLGALVDLVLADATFGSLVASGVWVGDVPSEKTLPFVALEHLGEEPRWTSEAVYVEATRVRWHVFAEAAKLPGQANPTEAVVQAIKDATDWKTLALTGGQSIRVQRTGYTFSLDPNRSPDDERVYAARIDQLIEVQRALAG
jgi:hypothetical protein